MWAAKYLDLVTPEIILADMAKSSGKTQRYLEQTFNKNSSFDKDTQALKAISHTIEGKQDAAGTTGQLVGSIFGAPIPWRLVRDGDQLWTGLNGGEVYKVNSVKPETFWQGFFKGGMLDYKGVAPQPAKSNGASSSRPLTLKNPPKPKTYKGGN